ncbi:MAG: hypothetical protein QOJ64_3527 [Acidobacteriota bacterium]|jgi:hypothetical protein|nr:hypothetical protein [Acidobacteriota bacterium]
MKNYRWLLLGIIALAFLAHDAAAQSYRLRTLAEQLESQASDLAERSYSDYRNSSFSNRTSLDSLFLAQQFSASANVFHRMVSDGRREPELRDASTILTELARRSDRGFGQRSQWSSVQRTLDDILRELNAGGIGGGIGGGSGGGEGPRRDDEGGRQTGRLRWRGTVDDEINLVIRDDNVEVRTIGGSEYNNATFNFTSPLPRRRLSVAARLLNGRGEVRVIQQPSRDNDFTAVVQIRDTKGGARDYEIEVTW